MVLLSAMVHAIIRTIAITAGTGMPWMTLNGLVLRFWLASTVITTATDREHGAANHDEAHAVAGETGPLAH